MPIKSVALVPFQIGQYNYTFCAYIIENLAYDVMLGADLLTHYKSVIHSDTRELPLPPPTDTPPPCPLPSQVGRVQPDT